MIVKDTRPGLHPRRLAALMRAAIRRCQLDLAHKVVLTEAASGAYVVTPVLAALAGARHVYALTKSTRYGTVEEVTAETMELAEVAGVRDRITVVTGKSSEWVAQADIITNSGHVRPINATMVEGMKPDAVIPLMYESWEFRAGDVDLAACRERGIKVAGTNERHASIDVFSYLGIMAVKLLLDAGIAVYDTSVLLLCDNPFTADIERGLTAAGAHVETVAALANAVVEREAEREYDAASCGAVLVALQPQEAPVLGAADADTIANRLPGTVVAQFWGDIDREAFDIAGVSVWPKHAPAKGHMGVLVSEVGPEPIIRLQAGGLKVGEVLARLRDVRSRLHAVDPAELAFVQMME